LKGGGGATKGFQSHRRCRKERKGLCEPSLDPASKGRENKDSLTDRRNGSERSGGKSGAGLVDVNKLFMEGEIYGK